MRGWVPHTLPDSHQVPLCHSVAAQTSVPTKGEYAAWEAKKDIPRAMGEGDQSRLSQLLMARGSLDDVELPDDPVGTAAHR